MTSANSSTPENEALLTKIGAIEQEVASVKVVVRRAARIRLVLLVAVLALIVGALWSFYHLARQFGSKENLNLLATEARQRVDDSSGAAIKEVRALIESSRPVLTKAFSQQVEADMPKYSEAITHQRDILVNNLQDQLSKKVAAHYEQSGKKYQAILQEEFPQVKDPELLVQLYGSIEKIMDKLVEKYYSEQLRGEVQELSDTWVEFDMADLPAKGDPPLQQQFMASLLQLAAFQLNGESGP